MVLLPIVKEQYDVAHNGVVLVIIMYVEERVSTVHRYVRACQGAKPR